MILALSVISICPMRSIAIDSLETSSAARERCVRALVLPHAAARLEERAIFSVEPTPTFTRCLEKLRARPGRPAEAAVKAERVLEALASGRATGLREAGALTSWGESRVTGCGKFNLGGGYRLIFSRRGGTVVPHFIGNHEECHRWLVTYRGLDLRPDRRMTPVARECALGEEDTSQGQQSSPAFPEIALSDRELRLVFAGLCGVEKSAAPEIGGSDCLPAWHRNSRSVAAENHKEEL